MNTFFKALVAEMEKKANLLAKTAIRHNFSHAKRHIIPKNPFQTIERKMRRRSRQFYS